MSILTDSLNRIQVWLRNNYPAVAESVTPGLASEEIQEIIQTLPFSLPEEICELYQWSRGHTEENRRNYTHIFDPYEGMALCSLERAIEIYPSFEDEFEECARKYIGKPLFPIFEFDGSYLCVVGDWEEDAKTPIIFVSEINEIHNKYTSLTSMILTIAECFENGGISFKENGHRIWNEEIFSSFYLKNNSNLLKFSVNKLKQELIMRQYNPVLIEMTINDFLGDISYLDRERCNLPGRQLEFDVLEPLVTVIQDENEIVRNLARQALEDFDYNFEL